MTQLVPVSSPLQQALAGLPPVAPERGALSTGALLAEDLCFPADLPARAVALREGVGVVAADLMGASAQMPLAIAGPLLRPGDALAPGQNAVLPPDAIGPGPTALREVQPGEGIRRVGHDARHGDPIARAGERLTARALLVAQLAGLDQALLRRPRVQLALDCPDLAGFAAHWARAQGARIVEARPDLLLRVAASHAPRLALAPGEAGWIAREGAGLVIDLPPRFDAALAVLLALAQPALAALSGAALPQRPVVLTRKIASAIGQTELVLLRSDPEGWHPFAAGLVTLSALSQARAYALIPPEIEGYPAGATVPAHPLDPEQDFA